MLKTSRKDLNLADQKTLSVRMMISRFENTERNTLINDLFRSSWKESRELYEQLREKIFELDTNIEEKFNKLYLSYKIENIFCEIIPQAKGLWIHITMPVDKIKKNEIELHDVSQRGHWGTGETKFRIEKIEDMEMALDYIRQSYQYSL
jgi:predicted transport protein